MTDLADRTSGTGLVESTRPLAPEHAPPERTPPVTPQMTTPWPRNAKLIIAVLAVLAVLGGLGTIIGFTTGDDQTPTRADLEATIETLTTERDGLVAQLNDVQADLDATIAERDALVGQVADLTATNDAIIAERDDIVERLGRLDLTTSEVIAVRDDLVGQLETLEATSALVVAERDQLLVQLAILDAEITTLTEGRDALTERVSALEAALTAQTAVTAAAIVERDALARLFPIELDATVDVDDVVGTYDLEYTQAFCDGFATCGTVPNVDELIIRTTADGRLEMAMPDNPVAGMMMVDGVLYAVWDSVNLAPKCGSTQQLARVTLTVFPHGLTIADDGAAQVTSLGAGMTVQAVETVGCPAGLTFYAAQLAPQT